MTRIYPSLDAAAVRARAEALLRFAVWEKTRRPSLSPADALARVAFLFDLLPASSRLRPVDPSGVMRMHRRLAVLGRRPR